MSIHIIEGLPRHGKSTYATLTVTRWQEYYASKKRPPRQIVTNFPMHLPDVHFCEDWAEMMRVMDKGKSIVVIDEAAEWFGAHDSQSNKRFMRRFRQHGHDGHTLYLIAHSASDLDVAIRDRTAETVTRIKRLFGPTKWEEPSSLEMLIGWWAIAYKYVARDYDLATKRHRLGVELFRLDVLHGKFDTLVKIGGKDEKITSGLGLAMLDGETGAAGRPGRRRDGPQDRSAGAQAPRWTRTIDEFGFVHYGQTVDDAIGALFADVAEGVLE